MAEQYETIECRRCGGLDILRDRCGICKGLGVETVEREAGHHTLSDERAGRAANRPRYGEGGDVAPRTSDPLWAGADKSR